MAARVEVEASFAFMMMHTCHLGCFMGMRVLSCAALALISPLVFALWLAAECFVFTTAARIYFNTYTFFRPIPRLLQHIVNVLAFVMVGFVPVFIFEICIQQYADGSSRCHSITGAAPFAMMFTAIQMQMDSTLTMDILHECMKIVGILAGVSATLAYTCATWFMERKYNYLWWSTRNPALQDFSEYIWDSGIYEDIGFELDDHRAEAIAYTFIPNAMLTTPAWKHGCMKNGLNGADPPLWFIW